MSFTIRITSNNLRRAATLARRAAAEAVEEVAEEAKELARNLAPVDTGAMRGSIDASRESETDWLLTEGGPTEETPEGVDYAVHVEFGHHTVSGGDVPPQPHFTPAVEDARAKLGGRVAEKVRRALG